MSHFKNSDEVTCAHHIKYGLYWTDEKPKSISPDKLRFRPPAYQISYKPIR